MIGDLMGKMEEAKKAMEQAKKRLETITVDAEAGGGAVKVKANGNKKITGLGISPELISSGDKEELEDLVIVAVNRATEQAEKVYEAEMQSATRGFLPNLPGM
jgi:hypothetical protein